MGATLWEQTGKPLLDAQNTIGSERIIATAAQTVLLLTSFAYVLGAKSILLFKNGKILVPALDYTETSTISVTLTLAAVAGDVFVAVGFIKVFDATASVETIYRNLNNVYLGAAATDPSVNGNGGALTDGAIYFNTATGLRAYYAGVWQSAGIPIAGTLLSGNNLSDLASLATARQNLGVRIYSVNISLANQSSKKITVANAAALVGANIIAGVIAVSGDTLNDELEITPLVAMGNCQANGVVTLFLHADSPTTNTFTVSYIIQS